MVATITTGQWVYCKTLKYDNGILAEIRDGKYVIDCPLCRIEISKDEFNIHFTWEN